MALEAYLQWKIVISNTWLAFPHIRFYVPSDLPKILDEIQYFQDNRTTPNSAPLSYLIQHWIEYSEDKPLEYFIICDEWGLFFNARNWKKNFDNDQILEMFTQPRKFGMQIMVITQDLWMLDTNFVRLSQEIVEMTVWLWFFRKAYSYDKKYLQVEWWWTPDIPVIATKKWWHNREISMDNNKFFWGLYYTREVLWSKALRRPDDITSLSFYLGKYQWVSTDWVLPMKDKLEFLMKSGQVLPTSAYKLLTKSV